jgi:DNA polymerase sigma
MNLPTIDISTLPDLDKLTGVFGSFAQPLQAASSDDTIVIIMAFLYEVLK